MHNMKFYPYREDIRPSRGPLPPLNEGRARPGDPVHDHPIPVRVLERGEKVGKDRRNNGGEEIIQEVEHAHPHTQSAGPSFGVKGLFCLFLTAVELDRADISLRAVGQDLVHVEDLQRGERTEDLEICFR